ncbi:DUF2254 domain-containing protein [Modestobacter sp. VKM Ac-2977]|uniref:DUF2254 domain-containing protein n=1 Tax=Modestobacter sp. VKM Ac-2977 TaxID=3004131 RepID=UPI0022AB4547|nr:DUF2254 domain-containing protein [Modestobacter sp. VKM Ac-2977]MCZ2820518.1 DUF2254 domain-containing protein [Modestobacter sp. VKM Ac-2977]
MRTSDSRRGGLLSRLAGKLRGALWPIPALGVLLAIVLGTTLPELDQHWATGRHPLAFAFGGGASAARDLLAAIAGSLISVTGVTFSLTVVALQLSSSQYTPRLLQTFVTDRVVQLTLAQLVLTFVYALTVLRTVRAESATEDDSAFVPRLSITVAYLLTLGSVLGLVLFLGHLSRLLRVETMLRDVHDEATQTIARELDDPGEADREAVGPRGGGQPLPLVARSSGFLTGVDERVAVAAAREAGVTVELAVRIGDSVVEGTPVAHAWALAPGGAPDTAPLEAALHRSFQLHYERTPDQDLAYGLRKVVDICVRALSPGTNDPTTAVHALSHASSLLGRFADCPVPPRTCRDEEERIRLVVPPWQLPELLQLAVEEPLQFAEGQPTVLRRLAGLLREFAWRAQGRGVDDLVCRYVDAVAERALESTSVPESETRAWRQKVRQALAGSWPAEVG